MLFFLKSLGYALKLLLERHCYCLFVSDTNLSNGSLGAATIALIGCVAALVIVVALLVIRMKCRKRVADISSQNIGVDNAANSAVHVIDEEGGGKTNGVVM